MGAKFDDSTGSNSGSAYIYNTYTGSLVATIPNPSSYQSSWDQFGLNVGIGTSRALISAHGDGSNDEGKAHIYDISTGNLLLTRSNPDSDQYDYFGRFLSSNGNYAVIGAYDNDVGGASDAGSAYLYDITTGSRLASFDNPNPASTDHFGFAAAVDLDTVVIGAPNDDGTGKVYIYHAGGDKIADDPVPDVASGLVGHWKLDETSGTSAADSSGSGNSGTLTNMDPASDWVDARINGGLDFDGVNDTISLGDQPEFDVGTAVTYSAWVKSTGMGGRIFEVWIGGGSSENKYLALNSSNQIGMYLHDIFGGQALVSNQSCPLNVWCHVAATYDGSTAKLYLNGLLVAQKSASGDVDDSTGNAFIGFNPDREAAEGNGGPFEGSIDDVRIYNRALTASEIKTLALWCDSPVRSEGSLLYNADHNVLQYCDGSRWRAIGK